MANPSTPLLATTSSNKKRLPGVMQAALRGHQLNVDGMIPAKVVSFDRVNNWADVQPLIMWVDTQNNNYSRFQLTNVPVISLGGGGFHINFPLKSGDLGWICASDRDISLFLQTLGESAPPTGRLHKFEDGLFIPDVFRKYTINSADSAAMVIQSVDGTTRISISEGTINITAPTAVNVTTPMATFSQNVHVEGSLTVDQNATVTGMTQVNGGFNATGGGNQVCTLPQSTTINGINVANHGHTQQNNGVGRTANGMIT